jgi:hypothetical protein
MRHQQVSDWSRLGERCVCGLLDRTADTMFSCSAVTSSDQGFPVWLYQWNLLYPPFPASGSP